VRNGPSFFRPITALRRPCRRNRAKEVTAFHSFPPSLRSGVSLPFPLRPYVTPLASLGFFTRPVPTVHYATLPLTLATLTPHSCRSRRSLPAPFSTFPPRSVPSGHSRLRRVLRGEGTEPNDTRRKGSERRVV